MIYEVLTILASLFELCDNHIEISTYVPLNIELLREDTTIQPVFQVLRTLYFIENNFYYGKNM